MTRSWGRFRRFSFLMMSIVGLAAAIAAVIRLPSMPYNVRELFGGAPGITDLFGLSVVMLSPGMIGAVVADAASRRRAGVWLLPIGVICLSVLVYATLARSVTIESLIDITGSTNLFRDPAEGGFGPTWAKEAWQRAGSPDVVWSLERTIRFVALYVPAPTWMSIWIYGAVRAARSPKPMASLAAWTLAAAMANAPLLWLAHAIVFAWPSTDNIIELIEPASQSRPSGAVFLHGALILITAHAAWLALLRPLRSPLSLALTLLSLPLVLVAGWWLVRNGLVNELTKYGFTYSGFDFLLGPDRAATLSTTELVLRWSALQTLTTAGLAWGAWCLAPAALKDGSAGHYAAAGDGPAAPHDAGREAYRE